MKKARCSYEPVAFQGGKVVVTCRLCGPMTIKRPLELARALEDPGLARFETNAPRPERLRLAAEIRAAVKLTRGRR